MKRFQELSEQVQWEYKYQTVLLLCRNILPVKRSTRLMNHSKSKQYGPDMNVTDGHVDRTSSVPSLSSFWRWIRVRVFDLEYCSQSAVYYDSMKSKMRAKNVELWSHKIQTHYSILNLINILCVVHWNTTSLLMGCKWECCNSMHCTECIIKCFYLSLSDPGISKSA